MSDVGAVLQSSLWGAWAVLPIDDQAPCPAQALPLGRLWRGPSWTRTAPPLATGFILLKSSCCLAETDEATYQSLASFSSCTQQACTLTLLLPLLRLLGLGTWNHGDSLEQQLMLLLVVSHCLPEAIGDSDLISGTNSGFFLPVPLSFVIFLKIFIKKMLMFGGAWVA